MTLRYGSPEEAGMSAARVRRLLASAREWTAREGQQAAVLLAARKGVVVIHEAFGRLRPEADSPPVRLDTLFPVLSIAKPVTATAAMILVEEGRLGLNLPVSYYLPEFSGEGKDAVTILHLLTHTSGFRQENMDEHVRGVQGSMPPPQPEPTQHPEVARYLSLCRGAPLWKRPGEEMSYARYNYCLLGEVIRRVSGRSLDDFARERVFEPLSMKDTCYGVRKSLLPKIVVRPGTEAWLVSEDAAAPWPPKGLVSTAMDLALFGQMFLNGGIYGGIRILAPTTVAAMTRNQIPGISARHGEQYFPEACWGLGWEVAEGRKGVAPEFAMVSRSTFCHDGWGGSFLWVDPERELVGVYLPAQDHRSARFPRTQYQGKGLFVDSVTAAVEEV